MSVASRMTTRSASRAGTPLVAPLTSKAGSRASKHKRELVNKTSFAYGSAGQLDAAQQLDARMRMAQTVGRIESNVAEADAADAAPADDAGEEKKRRETRQGEPDGNSRAGGTDVGSDNVSRSINGLGDTQLTGIKSSPRDPPLNWDVPVSWKEHFLFSIQPVLSALLFVGFVSIAAAVIFMTVRWKPVINGLISEGYNSSFARSELGSMHRQLEEHGRQLEQHDHKLTQRLDKRDHELRQKLEKDHEARDIRLAAQDDRITRYTKEQHNRVLSLFQEQDLQVTDRLEKRDRRFEEFDTLLNSHDRLFQRLAKEIYMLQSRIYHSDKWSGRINYFQPKIADIRRRTTSPTIAVKAKLLEKLITCKWEYFFKPPTWVDHYDLSEGPLSIFRPWHTFDNRWCAPSVRAKLQVHISLAYEISPEALVVEHMPKDELPDYGSTPKEIEIWIEILEADKRKKVVKAITKEFPDIMTKEASQRGKTLPPDQALSKNYVPVGRWMYDINMSNNIQTFYIPPEILAMDGLKTRNVVFRANSNWGSKDATCIYRLRMYGKPMYEPIEYKDLEEI